jgi:drug/metabolite transporter (DMT)-like permease
VPDVLLSNRARGVLLAVGGAALISFDGLLIRLQNLTPGGVVFWRGLLSGIAFAMFWALARRRLRSAATGNARAQSRPLLALTGLMVLATFTWVLSLTHTTVAHTLVIGASAPILTAVLGRLLLHEHLAVRTWLAGFAVLIGVAIVFSSSLGGGGMQGDLWAVANAVVFALILITLRRYQQVDRVLAMALSGFVVAVIVSPWGAVVPDTRSLLAAAVDGLVVLPGGLVLITMAPRYIPAAEVGLYLLMETVLAPIWVLVAVGEALSIQVVVSGAIILGAISAHSFLELKNQSALGREPVEV